MRVGTMASSCADSTEKGICAANGVIAHISSCDSEFTIHQDDAKSIAEEVEAKLLNEPNIVSISIPPGCTLTVVGDLHGKFVSCLRIQSRIQY